MIKLLRMNWKKNISAWHVSDMCTELYIVFLFTHQHLIYNSDSVLP